MPATAIFRSLNARIWKEYGLLVGNLIISGGIMPTNLYCPRIARMDTKAMRYENGDRVGRTNLH